VSIGIQRTILGDFLCNLRVIMIKDLLFVVLIKQKYSWKENMSGCYRVRKFDTVASRVENLRTSMGEYSS
jgi:hypothetical protein